jgi:hypothetical protein
MCVCACKRKGLDKGNRTEHTTHRALCFLVPRLGVGRGARTNDNVVNMSGDLNRSQRKVHGNQKGSKSSTFINSTCDDRTVLLRSQTEYQTTFASCNRASYIVIPLIITMSGHILLSTYLVLSFVSTAAAAFGGTKGYYRPHRVSSLMSIDLPRTTILSWQRYVSASSSSSSSCGIWSLRAVSGNDDTGKKDNDGWDDDDSSAASTTTTLSSLQQQDKLARLCSAPPKTKNDQAFQGERDFFIPIFTLVAITGFVGAYGYEMVRLYSRGELYLPWDQ